MGESELKKICNSKKKATLIFYSRVGIFFSLYASDICAWKQEIISSKDRSLIFSLSTVKFRSEGKCEYRVMVAMNVGRKRLQPVLDSYIARRRIFKLISKWKWNYDTVKVSSYFYLSTNYQRTQPGDVNIGIESFSKLSFVREKKRQENLSKDGFTPFYFLSRLFN